jgi:hypothetical protein
MGSYAKRTSIVIWRAGALLSLVILIFPSAIIAQHSGRHGSVSSNNTGTTPAENPDAVSLKKTVAEQATDDQVVQFRVMRKKTEAARQQAQEIEHSASTAGDSQALSGRATALQSSAEQALDETQRFRRSFNDSQEATLKNLAKKLMKSEAAASKSVKRLSQALEHTNPEKEHLASAAAGLEKELANLTSDQLSLGKEMGIQSQ